MPPVIRGNRTLAVRITDITTRTHMTAAVKTLSFFEFTHGPRTSLSLHRSKRKTVALGQQHAGQRLHALGQQPERHAGGQHQRRLPPP